MKDTKILSKIITSIGGFLGGPGGAIAGAAAGVGLNKAGYGRKPSRPSAKQPQYGGIGRLIPSGLPMRAKPIYIKPQTGGNSPFMLTTNSSFNSNML